MQKTLKVLGIDPAFANMGFAIADVDICSSEINLLSIELVQTVADKANKKTVRKNSDDLRRVRELVGALKTQIEVDAVDLVIAEIPAGAQNARAASTLGMVVGILGTITAPMIEVTPLEVKLATGDKHADKQQIIEWAYKRYPHLPWATTKRNGQVVPVLSKNEHMADAIATLHAGVATQEFKRLTSMWRILR